MLVGGLLAVKSVGMVSVPCEAEEKKQTCESSIFVFIGKTMEGGKGHGLNIILG